MRPIHRLILASAFVCAAASTAVAATAPATGLGQAWPNATDRSASPHFHAYRFEKQGVHYLQVNGEDGTVRGAIAIIDGAPLVLPIGTDADHWVVAEDQAGAAGQSVYQDDEVSIRAMGQPDGTMRLMAIPCNALICSVKGQ